MPDLPAHCERAGEAIARAEREMTMSDWRILKERPNYEATQCGKARLVAKKNWNIVISQRPAIPAPPKKGPILKYRPDKTIALVHPINGSWKHYTADQIRQMWEESE